MQVVDSLPFAGQEVSEPGVAVQGPCLDHYQWAILLAGSHRNCMQFLISFQARCIHSETRVCIGRTRSRDTPAPSAPGALAWSISCELQLTHRYDTITCKLTGSVALLLQASCVDSAGHSLSVVGAVFVHAHT